MEVSHSNQCPSIYHGTFMGNTVQVKLAWEITLMCFVHDSQINNGVYRAGFARSQVIYDVAVRQVFDGLDKVNYLECYYVYTG